MDQNTPRIPEGLAASRRTALVTGGSQGLGRALGRGLAAAGARVVLVARHAEPLARVVAEIRAVGGEAHAIVADVGDKDAVPAIAGQAAALVGPIDLLVNNASTLGPVPLRLLLDTDCEDLERAMAVNLVGPFRLTKAIAGPMVLRGAGTIVNITSDAATEAYERWGAYGASKAALEQLGRVWAAELAGTGVRVFTVDPGEMDTQMHADAIPDADRAQLSDPARVAARIIALVAGEATAETPPGARVAIRVGAEAQAASP
jgi:NAD(P)-dependent dehydrogenase (short-subunit alcohol dehydrogenase family)